MPLAITIIVFKFLFEFLDNLLGPVVVLAIKNTGFNIPEDFAVPGLGVATTVILVFSIGLITTNYIGRKMWAAGEFILAHIPVIRSVYSGAKQVIETFATGNAQAFRKVILLEYPRKGLYTLAFITGATSAETIEKTEGEFVNIYVPTTPNPTSGFMLMLPKEEVVELEMSVEDGLKMIISGGVVTPEVKKKVVTKSNDPAALE